MILSNLNTNLAVSTIRELLAAGVEEFCVCPSSRNAPWVAVLSQKTSLLRTYYFYEERSAAFFALGRIRQTGKPVAVVTTSGTAVGELLPATMEAHYSGLPLVLLTADRPRRYRMSGAPQSAEQFGIFGTYVSACIDIEGEKSKSFSDFDWSLPIHINVCFEEPLLEPIPEGGINPYRIQNHPGRQLRLQAPGLSQKSILMIDEFFEKVKNPLVIVGMIRPEDRQSVLELLEKWRYPVYLEGLSGLREKREVRSFQVHLPDRILERANQGNYPVDGIIRIGGVPTLRLWRDLEYKYQNLPVLSLSSVPFSGLARVSSLVHASWVEICKYFNGKGEFSQNLKFEEFSQKFIRLDQQAHQCLQEILLSEPLSEPAMISALSQKIPAQSRIYLGNSMPIREWDLTASKGIKSDDIWASRGVNGIDGQISSFIGFAKEGCENWGILGDLTTLYDLPGPWILPQLSQTRVNIVVVNNGGGKIFSRMFPLTEFQNQHQIRFHSWAELWGLDYEKWDTIPNSVDRSDSSRVIEVVPNEEATSRFWKEYQAL